MRPSSPSSCSGWRLHLSNIYRLGLKELRSLWADKVLLGLIVWAFSGAIYEAATGVSQELRNAPVAVVDQDQSALSRQLIGALAPPQFKPPVRLDWQAMDTALDRSQFSFVLVIPPNFARDLHAGRQPSLQLNVDATVLSQAFLGASYIQNIVASETASYLGQPGSSTPPVQLVTRSRFNPNLTGLWFGGVMETINNITMLTIILVGAAFLREREHGTLEHLLVMPLTPFEIMLAKIWASGVAVLLGASFSLIVVVKHLLQVPLGSGLAVFLGCAALYLFAAASIGIFLGTIARSMPQLGLLIILTIVPLQLLSGGMTPRESMPETIQDLMLFTPTTYFVKLAQACLYRDADFALIWPDLLAMIGVGLAFFLIALTRFRKAVTQTQI